MPLQFQNYGAAFANAPEQRVARDRTPGIMRVGEEIAKLQEQSNLNKEKAKREALLSDGDKRKIAMIQNDIDSLQKDYDKLSAKRSEILAEIADVKNTPKLAENNEGLEATGNYAGISTDTGNTNKEFEYGDVAV